MILIYLFYIPPGVYILYNDFDIKSNVYSKKNNFLSKHINNVTNL